MRLPPAIHASALELSAAPKPLLIASDLDGTLAPIVNDPKDACVPRRTLAILKSLQPHAEVAIVTGRDLASTSSLVPLEGVSIIASHGLEASFEPGLLPPFDKAEVTEELRAVADIVKARIGEDGLRVEHKTLSLAFHFRNCPDQEGPLLAILADLPAKLRLQRGRMVAEVLPKHAGKDVALEMLVAHHNPRSILVLGDDRTDIAMFKAAHDMRTTGFHVLVGGVNADGEAPTAIVELADVTLASPAEVQALLAKTATLLDRE